ncbi:hypothetical protein TWF225_010788 [Orbilia oligospora]|uniref:Yeast cell wall synthesis Kre9/Knh1-like N-terminal domain-containing protein n=1 Tax=Orbilia oligospora TaxID=2813651 RepID=A0A7C8PC15_ORBOL|nr:hypothetical protein TWF751_011298 [Orbilia oligospora]KAF3170485.1 hypothetical protein TWF225_010788 [Orbilia oligospora]KAF3243154.1 hypothetical protein TWF217_011307 [Orbilia oligospora]KAF3268506.1 hypothetical protein TWF128_006908 [Orbilia oligospora]KAF3296978.1 hypothetical protein TWF132_008351 [Orbilia oligospora]
MVSTRSLLLFSLASLASIVSFVSAETTFIYSSNTAVYPIGQPITIQWETNYTNTPITLSYCRGAAEDCKPLFTRRTNINEYVWTPDDKVAYRSDYFFFLAIAAEYPEYVASTNFEIVAPSSSTAGPSSTSGSGTAPTDGAAITTGPSRTGTSVPDASGDSTSNGTIIGAAVGAVAGVVILAVIGFIWMRKRNQKKLAEARRSMGQDDVEAGEKKKLAGAGNGAAVLAASDKKKVVGDEAFASSGDKKQGYAGSSNEFAMAELPAVQQEVFEMAAAPASGPSGSSGNGGAHFFAMELDSREIPRPGSSTVKPDNDPTSKPSTPAVVKHSMDKGEGRGVSIDGTTVNSETERPTSMGSIEQIKESSREGSQRDLTQQDESAPRTPAPNTPGEDSNGAGPSNNRDSTPQIGSIPKLGGFDFDTAKF